MQLFDLAADLAETNNLAAARPDLVRSLATEMEQLIARGRSTPGPDLKNDTDVNLWKRTNRPSHTDDTVTSSLVTPLPWQVFQRRYPVPQYSNAHHPGGPARGFADVVCQLKSPLSWLSAIEYRLVNASDSNLEVLPGPKPVSIQTRRSGPSACQPVVGMPSKCV